LLSVVCEDDLIQESEVGIKCTTCMKTIEKPSLETFGLSAEEAVREMRFRIYQATCLTASAGEILVSLCNFCHLLIVVSTIYCDSYLQ